MSDRSVEFNCLRTRQWLRNLWSEKWSDKIEPQSIEPPLTVTSPYLHTKIFIPCLYVILDRKRFWLVVNMHKYVLFFNPQLKCFHTISVSFFFWSHFSIFHNNVGCTLWDLLVDDSSDTEKIKILLTCLLLIPKSQLVCVFFFNTEKRYQVAKEILETEKKYLSCLRTLKEVRFILDGCKVTSFSLMVVD